MELSYNQETETITLKKGRRVLMKEIGHAAALAFVGIECGRHTAVFQKLAHGASPEDIKQSRRIQDDMIRFESHI